ncbi:hypothetical protein GH714_024521 [Hevea brasiliensis]|uniref:Cystatin domain-containing protein n=1 Tax=Hevea brasiliensis TaxID=3981 RepID=A0A6A6KV88_HEVBR|nr:hypothetical protein GH714_024521 [Hevea brasiliensis]
MKTVALSLGTLLLIGKICGTAKDNYGAEGTKWVQTDGKKPIDPIEIHQKALDDLVNVNSSLYNSRVRGLVLCLFRPTQP